MGDRRDELDRALEASTNRWMASGLVLLTLFVAVFPIYRSFEPGMRTETRDRLQASLAHQGAEIYDVNCASCHGIEGRGGIAPALATTQFLDAVDEEQITQLISLGVPGSEMVAYSLDNGGPLTAEQIRAIAVYLHSLEEEAADNPSWRYPLAAEGLTGRDIYILGCSRCHGVNLEGVEDFPGLGPGSDAVEESDSRLARRIREGKDEMPSFGGTLGDEQIQLLIDYMRLVQSGG